MMATVRYLVQQINQANREIRQTLGPALQQLEQWTGGHAASVAGAGPDSSPTPIDIDAIYLTKTERDASKPDHARDTANRARHLIHQVRTRMDKIQPRTITHAPAPYPAELALIQWHIVKMAHYPPGKEHAAELQRCWDDLDRIRNICRLAQPAQPDQHDNCQAHRKANSHKPISPRYRKLQLCRWCGDFKIAHGKTPPPAAIRLHDKGQHITPHILKRLGIYTPKRDPHKTLV